MKFQTIPVQIDVYRVDSQEGRTALQQHRNAFESRTLWDCWEIRTPDDTIEIVTRNHWIALDHQGGIRTVDMDDLLTTHVPAGPLTHCLRCGNPTGYDGIAGLVTANDKGLCPDCASQR